MLSTEERGRRISEGKIAADRRQREVLPPLMQGRKQCSRCHKWKSYDLENPDLSEFPRQRKRRKDGSVYQYPKSECRECDRKRKKADRERLKQEDPEEYKRRQKRYQEAYLKNKGRAHVRRLHREWSADRRRAEGVPERGPWKKYRTGLGPRHRVPVQPFLEWLSEWQAIMGQDDQELLRNFQDSVRSGRATTLKSWRSGRVTETYLDLVDEFFVAAGMPQLTTIYYT